MVTVYNRFDKMFPHHLVHQIISTPHTDFDTLGVKRGVCPMGLGIVGGLESGHAFRGFKFRAGDKWLLECSAGIEGV